MRIAECQVDGFGVWNELRLIALEDNLTVFYGPNEAGKTTLMQFMRGVLYGFDTERRQAYLKSAKGKARGGVLHLQLPGGEFYLARHSRQGGTLEGEVNVTTPEGLRPAGNLLATVLGDVDEPTFSNVFAVGLREMQELGALGDTEAARWLYRLTSGVDRVSLVDVIRELRIARERLLAPPDKTSQVGTLLAERERLRAEIEELANTTTRWVQFAEHRNRLDRQIAEHNVEQAEAQRAARVVQAALSVRDRYLERLGIDRRLEADDPERDLQPEVLQKIEEYSTQLDLRREQHAALSAEAKKLKSELAKFDINEGLWLQAPKIQALGEQQQWILSLEGQVGEMEVEVAGLEAHWQAQRDRIGLAGHGPTELSARVEESLRMPAKRLRTATQKLAQVEQELGAQPDAPIQTDTELESTLARYKARDLPSALESAGERAAQFRRRIALDQRLEELEEHRKELESQTAEAIDQQLMPVWFLAGLGGVVVLAVVFLLAGYLLESSGITVMGWLLGAAGLSGAMGKFLFERTATEWLATCRKQLDQVKKQVAQATDERDHLDAQLPRGGGPLASRLQAAEQELAALENLLPLDAQQRSTNQSAAVADAKLSRAKEELQAARRGWKNALSAAGLPTDLRPRQVQQLTGSNSEVVELGRRRARRMEELQQRQRDLQTISLRVEQIFEAAGIKPASHSTVDRVQQLLALMHGQESVARERDAGRKRLRELRRDESRLVKGTGKIRRRRHALLEAAQCQDEVEYRQRLETQLEMARLRLRRESLTLEIASVVSLQTTEAEVLPLLEAHNAVALAEKHQELLKQSDTIALHVRELAEQRGQIAGQQQLLLDDRRLAERQLELGLVEQRLKDTIAQWRVRAVVQQLLEVLRRQFEEHRQPETLIEASTYLKRLTEGHYTRVWTPLGDDVLFVDDANGHAGPVDALSRGTREQLFLSLRLSLVALYARRGIRLPLILDDVLVNFDSQRAQSAATVMRDFAKAGHQLLVFTCHEHVWKMFGDMKVDARRLPRNDDSPAFCLPARFDKPLKDPIVTLPKVEELVLPPPTKPKPKSKPVPVVVVEKELELVPEPKPVVVKKKPKPKPVPVVVEEFKLVEEEPLPPPKPEPAPVSYEFLYIKDEEITEEPTDLEEPAPPVVFSPPVEVEEEHPLQRFGALGWEVEIEEEWTNQAVDESEAA